MSARIKCTRIHQTNGPDYWRADCYMLDHTFQTHGMTQQQALNKMFIAIDAVMFADWYSAHRLNELLDYRLELNKKKEEYEQSKRNQLEKEKPPIKWRWWHLFYNPNY